MFALFFHIEHFALLIPKLQVIWNGFDDSIQDKCHNRITMLLYEKHVERMKEKCVSAIT